MKVIATCDVERARYEKRRARFKWHTHDYGEVLFVAEGQGIFRTLQRDYPIREGMAVIVPPGMVHYTYSEKECVVINVVDRHQKCIATETPLILKDNEEEDGRTLASMLFRYRHVKNPFVSDLKDSFIRFWMQRAELAGATEEILNKVYQALLSGVADKNLNLSAILTADGYAEDYIRMLFRKRYGVSPLKFLAQLRMDQACSLMETYRDLPLAEVAARCGYDDYVYFSKTFKAHTGESPRQYLKKIQ